ncbi:BRCA1-A complex subunit BRE [Liparis tanakae]|uniref:BRISC and BRCA1-A complex member 2 n=1 Tax=Liparis tanakae TaxID=230148 RepID=A0A4Z2G450_9TELE|nr:BRCA1-A complex subunit BRE [Liparis tanakae]
MHSACRDVCGLISSWHTRTFARLTAGRAPRSSSPPSSMLAPATITMAFSPAHRGSPTLPRGVYFEPTLSKNRAKTRALLAAGGCPQEELPVRPVSPITEPEWVVPSGGGSSESGHGKGDLTKNRSSKDSTPYMVTEHHKLKMPAEGGEKNVTSSPVDNMNNMSPEVTLHRISPELRPLLSSVVRNGRVGLDSTNCLRVTDLKTGCTSLTAGPCCDRFKLHIPYAGETLKCE